MSPSPIQNLPLTSSSKTPRNELKVAQGNRNAPLWKVPADEFSRVVDVNVKGVANVIRHFLPAMIKRRRGTVVNFSSWWGREGAAEVAPYCATKWAIEGLTRAMAAELPCGMAAVPVIPGIIDTAMLRSCFGAFAEAFESRTAAGRAANEKVRRRYGLRGAVRRGMVGQDKRAPHVRSSVTCSLCSRASMALPD